MLCEFSRKPRLATLLLPQKANTLVCSVDNAPILSRVRKKVLLGLLIVVSLSACKKASLSGDAGEFQVASSSMAPRVVGPTLEWQCKECSKQFAVAVDTYRDDLPTRCPDCGGLCSSFGVSAGQTIRFNSKPNTSEIPRLAIVAVRGDDSRTHLKRVWGLPGETLTISSGELWIDDNLFVKSFDEFREVAVPIARYPYQATANPRSWSATENKLKWTHHRIATDIDLSADKSQWMRPAPLSDDLTLNQGASYSLQDTSDLCVRLQLKERLTASVVIKCRFHGRGFEIHLVPTAAKESAEANWITETQLEFTTQAAKVVEIGFFDGGMAIAEDNRVTFPHTRLLDDETLRKVTASDSESPAAEVSVVCTTGSVMQQVQAVVLLRDIVLRSTRRQSSESETFPTVPEGHFFVLGDNQPVSIDSRQNGPVNASRIIGLLE